MSKPDEHIKPKLYTTTDLAKLYDVDPRTMAKYMEHFGIKPIPGTYSLTPNQVKELFEKIGEP